MLSAHDLKGQSRRSHQTAPSQCQMPRRSRPARIASNSAALNALEKLDCLPVIFSKAAKAIPYACVGADLTRRIRKDEVGASTVLAGVSLPGHRPCRRKLVESRRGPVPGKIRLPAPIRQTPSHFIRATM
jgi:hypothetical protein